MSTTITIPSIEDATKSERNRSVEFTWDLGEVSPDDGDRKRNALAVLRISHSKAGINYFTYERTTEDHFTVSVNREYAIEATEGGLKMRSFALGNGLGIARIPAGNRYSAKKLREAVEQAIEKFEAKKDDPRVARYFDRDTDPKLSDR